MTQTVTCHMFVLARKKMILILDNNSAAWIPTNSTMPSPPGASYVDVTTCRGGQRKKPNDAESDVSHVSPSSHGKTSVIQLDGPERRASLSRNSERLKAINRNEFTTTATALQHPIERNVVNSSKVLGLFRCISLLASTDVVQFNPTFNMSILGD